MFPRLPRHFRPLSRSLRFPLVSLSSQLRVPFNKIAANNVGRNYSQGPAGGGVPGGLQVGMDKMQKGQALKEFVSTHRYLPDSHVSSSKNVRA